MNKKITLGLLILVIAIVGFIIARTQNGTFLTIYNISAIVFIILFSRKKN